MATPGPYVLRVWFRLEVKSGMGVRHRGLFGDDGGSGWKLGSSCSSMFRWLFEWRLKTILLRSNGSKRDDGKMKMRMIEFHESNPSLSPIAHSFGDYRMQESGKACNKVGLKGN
ncbi:unnamed protein product [Dovyalis caffra]|uniref:Uncharacterized protein n=1 Tax=Dovyalis caffra TaxID=77055 RepID=A0AAV1QPU6_9ROSI|nr:unnamed protein product [Dovyalis caffra]